MAMDVTKWLNKQVAWIRKASDTYIMNGIITDADINILAEICISEVLGEDCSKYIVEASKLLSLDDCEPFVLLRIDSIEGVNAIVTDKTLNFAKNGMTVIYGANGTGKSGYIRILKMVSGAPYWEEIKSNIYSDKKIAPKCCIEIGNEDENRQFLCDLTQPGQYDVLTKIDIFDAKVAEGYINDAREASFEPRMFELFRTLGDVSRKIKAELLQRKNNIRIAEYNIPSEYGDMEIFKKLYNITHDSKVEDFVDEWTEGDEKNLSDLKQKCQIEKNEMSIRLKTKQLEDLQEVAGYFKEFENFYTKENLDKIKSCAAEWIKKREAHKLATTLLEDNVDETDKANITNSTWIELWKVARKFFDETKLDDTIDFTEVHGTCPVCHQEISDVASMRMKTIDEYVNGETAKEEEFAKKRYLNIIQFPDTRNSSELTTRLEDFGKELCNKSKSINTVLEETKTHIRQIADEPLEFEMVDVVSLGQAINDISQNIKNEIQNLKDINSAEEQTKLLQSIRELEARKILVQNKKTIIDNINQLQKCHLLDQAIKLTATNKITSKSKELAQELITDTYVQRFTNELKKLSANGLEAELVQGKGEKGKIPYKIRLINANGEYVPIKDILSEGEKRAVALAAFFAETGGGSKGFPLIFDDPISSLDYEYEGKVVERLIDAAQSRQVIVFTHRISMVVGLSEMMEKRQFDNFTELSLQATKERKGVPDEANPMAGKAEKILNRLLNEELMQLKKMDELEEGFDQKRHSLCQQFRNCVEKSVEDYLLAGVVKRFGKEIHTKQIKDLSSIKPEDCKMIDDMMTKYSAYDHSMSDEAPLIEFSVEEIEADMVSFKEWIQNRKKQLS